MIKYVKQIPFPAIWLIFLFAWNQSECWNKFVNPCSANAFTHIETSLLICIANQSTDFFIKVTLAWHLLTTNLTVTFCWLTTKNCEHDVPLILDHSVWNYKQSPVKWPQRQKQCWTSLKWGKNLCLTYPSIPFIYCVCHLQNYVTGIERFYWLFSSLSFHLFLFLQEPMQLYY